MTAGEISALWFVRFVTFGLIILNLAFAIREGIDDRSPGIKVTNFFFLFICFFVEFCI